MKKRHQAIAYFSLSRIEIRRLIGNTDLGRPIKNENGFVLFDFGKGKYVYLRGYGGICFFGLDTDEIEKALIELKNGFDIHCSEATDEITVVVEKVKKEEGFGEIFVEDLSIETVHIICLNLSQSAALFHYQKHSNNLLDNTRKHTNELEQKGTFSLSRKRLMKYIGTTLNVKNKIAENLYIFNTPMLAYENETIHKIDS